MQLDNMNNKIKMEDINNSIYEMQRQRKERLKTPRILKELRFIESDSMVETAIVYGEVLKAKTNVSECHQVIVPMQDKIIYELIQEISGLIGAGDLEKAQSYLRKKYTICLNAS